MGGDACIAKTRIPVWLLVSYWQEGMSDSQILAGYPDISAADLIAAWTYAKAHATEIEAALRSQEETDASGVQDVIGI